MRVRSRKKDVRKEVTYKGLDCSKRSARKPVQNSREINGTIVAEEVWVASRRVDNGVHYATRTSALPLICSCNFRAVLYISRSKY